MEPMPDIANLLPPNYVRILLGLLIAIKALDEIVRLIPDRFLAGHTTVQAIVFGLRRLAEWAKTRKAPPAALLLLLLLPAPVFADLPAAEVRPLPPAAEVPVVTAPAPAPRPPTITEILSCTAADALTAIPSALSRCARNPTVAAPIDSRVFWTVLGSSLGNVAMTVGGILLQPYLSPDPVK